MKFSHKEIQAISAAMQKVAVGLKDGHSVNGVLKPKFMGAEFQIETAHDTLGLLVELEGTEAIATITRSTKDRVRASQEQLEKMASGT